MRNPAAVLLEFNYTSKTPSWWLLLRRSPGLLVVTLLCLGDYLIRGIGEQYSYRTTGFDLGIFDQAVRAYSHFQAPMVALKGPGYNVLGDHFHPIIALLSPLYWIWDSPYMLIIAQAFLMASAIPVIYRFARRHQFSSWLALLLCLAYGLGWPVQALIDFDFHEIAFATPILAFSLDAYDRRDDRSLIIWSILLLGVREDMGVIVALVGILRLLRDIRKPEITDTRRRQVGIGLSAIGAVTYYLTTSVVIPHFAHGGQFAYGSQFDSLGNSIGQASLNSIKDPLKPLRLMVQPQAKLVTLRYLLLPFLFLSLRSRYVILALPLIAERFLNSRSNLWHPYFHYNALPWLILTFALIDSMRRLGLTSASRWATIGRAIMAGWLVLFPVLLAWRHPGDGPVPADEGRDRMWFHTTPAVRDERATVAYLPSNTCIEATNTLVPHLTQRDYVSLPLIQQWHADFIALDMSAVDVGGNPPAPTPADVYAQALRHGYQVVFSTGSMRVLRNADYTGPNSNCEPLGAGKDTGR